MSSTPRVRRSLSDIQHDYDQGNKTELENLVRAWKGIKELPANDPNSFFTLGGLHGEPFRDQGKTDPNWWGGYCQHGTVLFPSWHRAYLWRLEEALRSIPGCQDVTLPFWDECSDESREKGLPSALTQEFFVLDGKRIENPLRSFVFPKAIVDEVKGTPIIYSKPEGYETVRYPLSGLVGTEADRIATKLHNSRFPNHVQNVKYLNDNISTWLSGKIKIGGKWRGEVFSRFESCLDAPTYTLFSNTTSTAASNASAPAGTHYVSLEEPHNFMHLAVGGFDYPGQGDSSAIPGANGDMGENETAGLDPIFFFHHCFIDYVFWTWQRRQGATDEFSIDAKDPGASYYKPDGVQPPAGAAGLDPNAILGLQTTLDPFVKADGKPFTTADCINIEKQLGYVYGKGSLDAYAQRTKQALFMAGAVQPEGKTLRVSRINRGKIRGSFLISAYATVDGKREYLGTRPILSRWHVEGCMNCQTHLEATATFKLPLNANNTAIDESGIEVEVQTRDTVLKRPSGAGLLASGNAAAATAAPTEVPFKLETF
ncbi:tyrosinase family protein [Pantoea sp. Ap-967]|uniref:tyrosinase family protein n=1 Tax=Pantoea sp. Ap-967 TaxID=2608362 RepID=UPI001421F8B1|nr:tyrosinase family protein [Pantoea sp. Ap-967]NIE75695.1 tyrosinase family protein [Pantoea sp. Ap-967]